MLRLIDQLGLVKRGDRVLDVGCGPGAMVSGLLDRAGREGSYVGFDVHRPSIEWCRRLYRGDSRCRFELARLASPYATPGGGPVEGYSFPIDDGASDFVLAKSVFTHLEPGEARRYLVETRRALRPGCAAIVTAFLFDRASDEFANVTLAFPFGDGQVRWRSWLRPNSAVAYEQSRFFELVGESGLRVQWMSAGYFPGAERLKGQDTLLLGL